VGSIRKFMVILASCHIIHAAKLATIFYFV